MTSRQGTSSRRKEAASGTSPGLVLGLCQDFSSFEKNSITFKIVPSYILFQLKMMVDAAKIEYGPGPTTALSLTL